MLSPEFVAALTALFPVVAYPFMYAGKRPCDGGPKCLCRGGGPERLCQRCLKHRCEVVILVVSFFSLTCIHIESMRYWLDGHPHADFPPWVIPLTLATFFVGAWEAEGHQTDPNWLPRHVADPESTYVEVTFLAVVYQVGKYVASFYRPEEPLVSVSSPHNAVCALALGLGVPALACVAHNSFYVSAATLFHRLAMRHVPGRFWFFVDEELANVSDRRWHVFPRRVLSWTVFVVTPLLTYLWKYCLNESVRTGTVEK